MFNLRSDDEFEDEPEDELASRGMHVVEGDEDEEKKPEDEDADDLVGEVVVVEVPEEVEKEDPEYKDGLAELEEMERTYVESTAPGFGSLEEPDEV